MELFTSAVLGQTQLVETGGVGGREGGGGKAIRTIPHRCIIHMYSNWLSKQTHSGAINIWYVHWLLGQRSLLW